MIRFTIKKLQRTLSNYTEVTKKATKRGELPVAEDVGRKNYPSHIGFQMKQRHMQNLIVKFLALEKVFNLRKKNTVISSPGSFYEKLPSWFITENPDCISNLPQDKPVFIYIPWIRHHGDKLIKQITSENYYIQTFDVVNDMHDVSRRRNLGRFVEKSPETLRAILLSRLIPIRDKITAAIFTSDWHPVLRLYSNTFAELGIPRVLVPHESVFANEELFYKHIPTGCRLPNAEVILAWGNMQKNIFVGRGIKADKVHLTGAPKFDAYKNFKPSLPRSLFCKIFGLSPTRKTVLFALQPLDSQFGDSARDAQLRALEDVFAYCKKKNAQLLIRMPPSADPIIPQEVIQNYIYSGIVAFDFSPNYVTSPEEALYHSDVVLSLNSTMLFEAFLLGKPSISVKYTEFDPIWKQAGISLASTQDELIEELDHSLKGRFEVSDLGLQWAEHNFSSGSFDGAAATRIRNFLGSFQKAKYKPKTAIEKVFNNESIDTVCTHSNANNIKTLQLYVPKMLNASRLNHFRGRNAAAVADLFICWGLGSSELKKQHIQTARNLGKDILFVEDGLIRSLRIGLSGDPALGIIIDDTTTYYDATKTSRLVRILKSNRIFSDEQIERAHKLKTLIRASRVSKYNHAPDQVLNVGSNEKKKILVVDQRFEDKSVAFGHSDETTFDRMLDHAISRIDTHDIIVKRHPDAITGGKKSYYSNQKMEKYKRNGNIHTIDYDINPHSLFDVVDEVYVATSSLGFEALIADLPVRCFGSPFYSGWGVTTDMNEKTKFKKERTLQEILYVTYIELSRYFHPDKGKACSPEELVRYIHENKLKNPKV